MASVRELLRCLPCRPSEAPRLRSALADVLGRSSPPDALLAEATYLLRAQRHLAALNARYFPQSGMSEREVVAATAARVGLRMPDAPPLPEPGSPPR